MLPRPRKEIHLDSFGYKLKKSEKTRQASLRKASKKYGALEVEKHLNLIRNLTKKKTKNKKLLSKDVEYMKKLYSREKKRKNTKRKK